ncbi:DUF4365 domain-containing protein [bacterium]|nr:DUF4365 domain-containing protein [bacterium]
MHITTQKEQFSYAYIRAVATVAGISITRPDVDDDKVDLLLKRTGGNGKLKSPQFDVQVKCTHTISPDDEEFKYEMDVNDYNYLINQFMYPRIVIIVIVPEDVNDWLEQSNNELVLRHCGYWLSLEGKKRSNNLRTLTLEIPKINIFTVDTLINLMDKVAQGKRL